MRKETTIDRLREILRTVNPNIVKEVFVKCDSNHIPAKLDWYEVSVGRTTYIVRIFDWDEDSKQSEINYMEDMLSGFDFIKRNPYTYYSRCRKITVQ